MSRAVTLTEVAPFQAHWDRLSEHFQNKKKSVEARSINVFLARSTPLRVEAASAQPTVSGIRMANRDKRL